MAIRIKRNEQGNCITFEGSSNPVYWNSCLSGEVDATDTNSVNVINDVITAQQGTKEYEFYRIPYTEFEDKDGNAFNTAQEAADYITTNANVVGLGGDGIDMIGTDVCFNLDDTSTSILMSTGHHFGVNSISAEPNSDGTIHIISDGGGDIITHFTNIEVGRVCIDGVTINGGLQDIANTLNELFSVGPFESVVISDPYSTMVADVSGVTTTYTLEGSTAVDPVGDDIFTNSSSGNYAGLKSVDTINQAGEYFTFDIRGEGQIGFGLILTQDSYDDGEYSGSATYADPTTFATSNSAHYGFLFSHWFHPTPNGSWTNYGANTSYVMGPAWYHANTRFEGQDEWLNGDPIKIKVGIDENGFISISSLLDDGVTWVLHCRTNYPVQEGAEFHLGIKAANSSPRVFSVPKVHLLEELAPTMNFRFIESPDGVYKYPLFTTEEEAEYYDTINGGSGESVTETFPDDPTNTQWKRPLTGFVSSGSTIPTSSITFQSNPINWTEITSLTNADLSPSSFGTSSVSVNEFSSVNINVHPLGATNFTTTIIDVDNGGFTLDSGLHVVGTAPEVTGDNVTNPSDTYEVTIRRTNSYGSVDGTLTIEVSNLTAPATAISGFTHEGTSTPLVDADTLDDGSVVSLDNTIEDGKRFIIPQSWIEGYVLPAISGGTGDCVYLGVKGSSVDWTNGVDGSDFDFYFKWSYYSATEHRMELYHSGSNNFNTLIANAYYDAYYDYGIEVDGTDVHLIACNANAINTEPAINDGGNFTNVITINSYSGTIPLELVLGTDNTQMDISIGDIDEIVIPVAPSLLTSWDKALDFTGSNQYLTQVSNFSSYTPLSMGFTGAVVPENSIDTSKTSDNFYSRPWATTIVFKSDRNNSNQHVWNYGEGAGTNNDNIALRLDANGNLYLHWGREGVGNNELLMATNISSSNWYGIYIAFKGTRLSGTNATATNLSNCFDVRVLSSVDNFASVGVNKSITSNWTSTGLRMDRSIGGYLTIGGRASNRSFHGKVASMLVTTLKGNQTMPTDNEISKMVTDPVKWVQNFKVGNDFRRPSSEGNTSNFQKNTGNANEATQVWLMGDGSLDNYSNGVRNYIHPSEQNYTKLQLNSMVSNDFENVNISGLS